MNMELKTDVGSSMLLHKDKSEYVPSGREAGGVADFIPPILLSIIYLHL